MLTGNFRPPTPAAETEVPQWKKDLIARLRSQNRRNNSIGIGSQQQLSMGMGAPRSPPAVSQQPKQQQQTIESSAPVAVGSRGSAVVERCSSVNEDLLDKGSEPGEEFLGGLVAGGASPKVQTKMVMDRMWEWDAVETVNEPYKNGHGDCGRRSISESDGSSEEDLHYGPGIVNKLRNKYLSLALRESNRMARASILPMRKAASLENMLDDNDDPVITNGVLGAPGGRLFQNRVNGNVDTGKNATNRYRNTTRHAPDMKRARSVETISRSGASPGDLLEEVKPKRESLHEDVLIKLCLSADKQEGSDKPHRPPPLPPPMQIVITKDNKVDGKTTPETNQLQQHQPRIINRPKRIAPMMNEREKPPADVVRQAKLIFERRPEQRTRAPHHTGEVAAKVQVYKSIIVQAKSAKKPLVKTKPTILVANGVGAKPQKHPTSKQNEKVDRKTESPTPKQFEKHYDTPSSMPISPIPDVSRIDFPNAEEPKNNSLCSTPDLIMTTTTASCSPAKRTVPSPTFRITETFIKEEIRNSTPNSTPPSPGSPSKRRLFHVDGGEADLPEFVKMLSPQTIMNIASASTTVTFNFTATTVSAEPPAYLPAVSPTNRNVSDVKTPPSQPLKLEINGSDTKNANSIHSTSSMNSANVSSPMSTSSPVTVAVSPTKSPTKSPPPIVERASKPSSPVINNVPNNELLSNSNANAKNRCMHPAASLTILEIEKNLINTAKTLLESPPKSTSNSVPLLLSSNSSPGAVTIEEEEEEEVVIKLPRVPKVVRKPPREPENNSIVFKFTDRKDVPDYVHNDGSTRSVARIEKPKVGEGGIILLPGASLDESFTDEDDEIMRSLEAPPSPCDVTFVNDNILIDGKSSLSQKAKKPKMSISFVEAGPQIFEYPSETSLLIEESPTSSPVNAQMGHTVPSLTGSSSLATYTPKSMEDFQPGVTRSLPNLPAKPVVTETESEISTTNPNALIDVERPILFSAGTNSDILF